MDLAYAPEYEAFASRFRTFLDTNRQHYPGPASKRADLLACRSCSSTTATPRAPSRAHTAVTAPSPTS